MEIYRRSGGNGWGIWYKYFFAMRYTKGDIIREEEFSDSEKFRGEPLSVCGSPY